ncbi:hypothetical protein Agub_g13612, partial [Astrephomene gubernaculifera]
VVIAQIAAKRRAARVAGTLARSCPGGQWALVTAGFARRVLNDVAAVLRSGEYESPYLEPLPYADPLAALSAMLADVLCWPGLLQLTSPPPHAPLPPRKNPAAAVRHDVNGGGGGGGEAAARAVAGEEEGSGAGYDERRQGEQHGGTREEEEEVEEEACGASPEARERHRAEVLALLQELVTWLDLACSSNCEGRGGAAATAATSAAAAAAGGGGVLPPQDAAVVSLGCFAALVVAEPSAAAALERVTNIRWYLHNLTGTTLPEEEVEGGVGEGPDAEPASSPSPAPKRRAAADSSTAQHTSSSKQRSSPKQQQQQRRRQQGSPQSVMEPQQQQPQPQPQQQEAPQPPQQHSDLLLDLARAVLGAMERRTTAA